MAQVVDCNIGGVDTVLRNFVNRLSLNLERIKSGNPLNEWAACTLPDFWTKLDASAKWVSQEGTKIAVMFAASPKPAATELSTCLGLLERAVDSLVATFQQLPLCEGLTLRKAVLTFVTEVLEAVSEFAKMLNKSQGDSDLLRKTGSIWEHCGLVSALPRDNLDSVARLATTTHSLVTDAVEEIVQAQAAMGSRGDGGEQTIDEEDSWSDSERLYAQASTGLLKTASAVAKKVAEAATRRHRRRASADAAAVEPPLRAAAGLDELAAAVHELSPAVDDLAAVFYATPVGKEDVLTEADRLVAVMQRTLNSFKGSELYSTGEAHWVGLLENAVEHNSRKVKDMLT